VDVAAGRSRIRITRHGSSGTLLDIPPQELLAGQRATLVILPVKRFADAAILYRPGC